MEKHDFVQISTAGENIDQPSPPSTDADSDADVIIMMSLSQSQSPTEKDASDPKDQQDVFLTPREKSLSLPISSDDPFENVPQSVDWRGDSEATVYDLGRDSYLGFSDVQVKQEMLEELMDRTARGINQGVVGENISNSARKEVKLSDPKSGFDLGFSDVPQGMLEELIDPTSRGANLGAVGDKFKGSEKELGSDENISGSSRNKMKLSDPTSGFDIGFSDVQLTPVMLEELMDRASRGANLGVVGDKFKGSESEVDSDENISESPGKKLKLSDPKSGFDSPMADLGIQSQKANEKPGSEAKTPICNVEKGSEKNNTKFCVFDVLKFLAENRNDNDDGVENLSLLEAFKKAGLSFPRPRWWPEDDSYRNDNDDDDVENLSLLEAFKKAGLSFPRPRLWPDSFKGRII